MEAPVKPNKEIVDFPWGRVVCQTWAEQDERPFHSFPAVRLKNGHIMERAFLLDRGYIVFSVPANQDARLQSTIWECMRSMRHEDK
jgi:hypothetical protein